MDDIENMDDINHLQILMNVTCLRSAVATVRIMKVVTIVPVRRVMTWQLMGKRVTVSFS